MQRKLKEKLVQLAQGTVKADDEIGKYLSKKRSLDTTKSITEPEPEFEFRRPPKKTSGGFDNW